MLDMMFTMLSDMMLALMLGTSSTTHQVWVNVLLTSKIPTQSPINVSKTNNSFLCNNLTLD
jgi:hypothetical protein